MQVTSAMAATQRKLPVELTQFRMIPDLNSSCYDLLLELTDAGQTQDILSFVDLFDSELGRANIEYAQKRASIRLGGLRLHLMNQGWSEQQWRTDIAKGKRDSQYKWSYIQLEWNEDSRLAVSRTFTASENREDTAGDSAPLNLDTE